MQGQVKCLRIVNAEIASDFNTSRKENEKKLLKVLIRLGVCQRKKYLKTEKSKNETSEKGKLLH